MIRYNEVFCKNLRMWVTPHHDHAGFSVLLQVVGERGEPICTIHSCELSKVAEEMQPVLHAFRMGQRYSKNIPEEERL